MRRVALSGPWKVRPLQAPGEYEQMLPSHWQEIPELSTYSGGVIYRLELARPTLAKNERAFLRLNGVFYSAKIRLNGTELGQRRGYFSPWEEDITANLQESNLLEIEVECSSSAEPVIMGVFAKEVSDNPTFNPGGIWLPVELIVTGVTYLRDLKLQYSDETSRLTLQVRVAGLVEGAVLSVLMHPANFSGVSKKAEFSLSQEEESFEWQMRDIALWWTHDMGDPNLYRVEATITVRGKTTDKRVFNYGFRTVKLDEDMGFSLNGRKLFLRGSNYFPTEALLAHTTEQTVRTDFRLAKEAHLNILRVHAHVGHPLLYTTADAMGLLLWQDMPLQGLYTHNILSQARLQTRELVALLYNHPSVAIWCMHQASLFTPGKGDVSWVTRISQLFNLLVFNWNRDVLDAELQRVAEQADPTRSVVRSSGEFGLFRKPTDTHLYYGWHKAFGRRRGFEILKRGLLRKNLSLVSEFGAKSLPNFDNARKLFPGSSDAAECKALLELDVLKPWIPHIEEMDLATLVDESQAYQAMLNQYYIDNLRFLKYRPTNGIMTYRFQDSQPAFSFSVVDYWREPKASYYALQKAMSPQYIFILQPKDTYKSDEILKLPIYAVNDAWEGYAAVGAVATLTDPDGKLVATDRYALSLPVDCQVQTAGVFEAELGGSGDYILKLDLVMPDRAITNSYVIRVNI